MDIAIALGGGGARGNAHIGVLRELERQGYRIAAIAGTSAGGIIGSLYAAGYSPDDIESRFSEVDQSTLFDRHREDGPALLGSAGVQKVLSAMLAEKNFELLKIPFAVTATDIDHGREVVLQQGQVLQSVLATIAIPGILPPQRIQGMRLVDGGVLDPVPVAVARQLAPQLPVIAVVLSPPPEKTIHASFVPLIPGPEPVAKRLARLRLTQAFDIFLQSIDIGTNAITELRLQIDHPDVIIRPEVEAIRLLDHADVHKLAEAGERAAQQALPEIKQAFTWQRTLIRRLRYGSMIVQEDLNSGRSSS